MKKQYIIESLCYYDNRNPYGCNYEITDIEEVLTRPENCSCDNCFCGRHDLANELLKYIK